MPKFYAPVTSYKIPMKPILCMMPMTPHLELPRRRFPPLRSDRTQRFTLGDRVRVVHGGFTTGPTLIIKEAADAHPTEYAHCSGRSAKYQLQGVVGWVYDWQLEAVDAPLPESKDVSAFGWFLFCLACAAAGTALGIMFANWPHPA